MKLSSIILIIFLGLGIGAVIVMYGKKSVYVTFENAEEMAIKSPGKKFHVVAKINKSKEQVYEPSKDPNYFSFYGKDTLGTERKIIFRNAKPSEINMIDKVVIIGAPKDGNFEADELLLKCPSKYENKFGEHPEEIQR